MRKALRLRRLSRPRDDKYLFVPLDHSVSDGPVVPRDRWHDLIRSVVVGGADAIIVHKGRVRTLDPQVLGGCALVVHLSAGTSHAADANAKVLVGEVEEALRLGADAVSVHVNIGSDTEERQLVDFGVVANACDSWNVPLVAMVYPRGPRIADPSDPALLAHVVNIAVDLGADLVKTNLALPVERMAEVVASCPIPVLVAGGPATGGSLVDHARASMATGCAGLAVGRRVFTSPAPMTLVAELASVIHADHPAELVHAMTGAVS
ncbi:2-amino-3,7-dideoxy-D-threo-hept-6-ulosonate synthase [Actinosynnema sp. NPDC047251]|uniref:2-amino-4,5-dihydroxy-6-one-heptanoic acid-7-phosphate synthase n=1 Tax=Saccharothrix espanaensis (strain ATCC 51144 / DSM 44229 / JCM 9112 / NBRC 15066 / NRRL 15764) TaxID=1179773 RepID=K0KAK8_SACES|nr:2-amino-3,7-dideoxy-D-threo-hept-6-ulosonate synthase [Saccharothrix espanaensis]CCH33633.1 2-amino-4,5-dihydroxy-6-one-heptanoic acid-7-phosphate synthase [Saccharothrix espanaensis DSM 44229]